MKEESQGGGGQCQPGDPGLLSHGLWEPTTWEGLSWEEGSWEAAHFCHCVPRMQVPAQQCPLPAPGHPEAAPVPEHARGHPLGEQASEGLCGRRAAPS